MADENLITEEDAKILADLQLYEWFNLKVSKNGGIHALMKILQIAKESGIKTQLGSHYGECGILESVRRQFGCSELLTRDITKENLNLYDDLIADLSYISDYGLGLRLKEEIEWK
jgi:L-alanine-DL-glutamate epimerase-like enolase superfamily enzyme